MPYLIGDQLLMYHVPKTAGIWIREACKLAGHDWRRLGDQHSDTPRYKLKRIPFVYVRHPATWLASFWRYHQQTKWQQYSDAPPFVFFACHRDGEPFGSFLDRYLDKMPGAVGRMFDRYLESVGLRYGHIGCVERLPNDLVMMFEEYEIEADIDAVLALKPLNASSAEMHSLTTISPEVSAAICEAEKSFIAKWYGGGDD